MRSVYLKMIEIVLLEIDKMPFILDIYTIDYYCKLKETRNESSKARMCV